jgi:DNA-directed RNA polymerase subunit RPC12/RpoP
MEQETMVKFCKNCGGQLEFDIASQSIGCKNCGFTPEAQPPAGEVREHDFHAVVRQDAQSVRDDAALTLKCPSCGAEISAAANAASVSCRYCGASQIIPGGRTAGVQPEAIAPFKLQKHEALALFTRWVKKRFFAPNALKTLFQAGKLIAAYVPFWTFDAHADGNYTGEGGKKRTRTVKENGQDKQVTEIDWYPVCGMVRKDFDDVLVYAGAETDDLVGKLVRFDLKSALVPFSNDYLAGFQAENYTVSPEQGFNTARTKMDEAMRSAAKQSILQSYDEARAVSVAVSYSSVACKQILLPVWRTGFTYRGKYYGVMVNGVSGEVSGKYPKSAAKIAIFVTAVIAVLAAVVAVILHFSA